MPTADPAESPVEFATLVTGGSVDEIDDGLVTDAMVAVFHANNLPPGYDRGAVADGMRGLVDAADLRIGAFGQAARGAAGRISDDLDDPATRAALPDDRPTDLPLSGDDVITVVFDVSIEDVSPMLSESGELVTTQREEIEAREAAGEIGQDRETESEGVGR